jgi:hypothetical protein
LNTPATATVKSLDLDSRRIFVIDGIFQRDLVRMLHEIFVRAPFTLSDFDNEQTRHIRHWKFDFSTEYIAANPALHHWHREIVARTSGLFPNGALEVTRVYCNNVFYGDHQHAHYDNDAGVTALYFANWQWEENWQGETIFYDREGEACHAVAPRPGRLVAFPANVLHRGGVPAKTCFQPRLTVAFKFAVAEI